MLARLLAAGALLLPLPAGAQQLRPDLVTRDELRVCADPANMPFSDEAGEGFENKIAELLARELHVPLAYTWYPQATGFIRNTLGAHRCDLVPGYAVGSDVVLATNAYYKSAWVLIYPKGKELDGVEALGDSRLQSKRIGLVAGSPPATILALHGLIGHAKSYALMVDRRFESPAEQMVRDIVSGDIDAGILWGPIGGYFAAKAGAPLAVVPLVREKGGPPMTFRVGFGVRPGDIEWKHRLNDFISAHQTEIDRILLAYGVPILNEQDQPITRP